MPERSEIVEALLRAAREIAEAEEFTLYAVGLVERLGNHEAADALRVTVLRRKTEAAVMRYVMSDLADVLATMPLEAS